MSSAGDTLVLFLLIAVILYFLGKSISPKKNKPSDIKKYVIDDRRTEFVGRVPSLLERHGYEVIHAKIRVPFQLHVDDEVSDCCLTVDYVAEADGEAYLVIVARGKRARLSSVTLKETFLPYYLFFKPAGILYVNREKGSIKLIDFEIPEIKM
jgi:hypothetical protein